MYNDFSTYPHRAFGFIKGQSGYKKSSLLERKVEKLLALTSLLHHDQEPGMQMSINEISDDETGVTKPVPSASSANVTGSANPTAHNTTEVIVTALNEDELEAGTFKNTTISQYFLLRSTAVNS